MTGALDPSALDSLRELERLGAQGLVGRMAGAFLSDVPGRLDALRRGVTARDAPAVSVAAHTLKGSCSYLGATGLRELCARMEKAADADDFASAAAELERIELELVGVLRAVEDLLS